MRSWKVDLLTPSAGNFIYFHANRNSGWADSEEEKQRERERLPPEYTCWRTTAKGKITFNSFLCMKAWGRESDNGQTIFKITGKRQRWNQKMNIPQRRAFLSPSSLPSVPSVFFYLDPLRIKLYFVVTEKHKTPFTEWRTVRSTSNREDVTGINHSDFSFFCLLVVCLWDVTLASAFDGHTASLSHVTYLLTRLSNVCFQTPSISSWLLHMY